MKRERRSVKESITRITTLGLLAALGFVLMAFAQFPYPLAPWLKIEISEIITIIAYALYGLPGGLSVALIKTLLNLAVHGPVGLGIGDLTAFITSCMFILGLFITSHLLRWFKKGLGYRILSYAIIAVLVAVVLTTLNAIVITPSYLTVYGPNPHFSTCFDEGVIQDVINFINKNLKWSVEANVGTYIGIIAVIYVPFNLMKAIVCCLVYELIFNRLIFVFMRQSPFFQKWFVGNIFTKKVEEETSTEENKDLEAQKN